MLGKIRPRRIQGWEFFNENTAVCDAVRPGGLAALGEWERTVVELFVGSLGGCCKVLDVGCGSGFPGLYVAPHVGELVGADAAPNMIAAARANAEKLSVKNASFQVVPPDRLPFSEGEFDGVAMCGLLESLDWESVPRMVGEAWRVLSPGGRLAALDQDWQDVLRRKPLEETEIRYENQRLILRHVRRRAPPHLEIDTRCLVDPQSTLGRRLKIELAGRTRAATKTDCEALDPADIRDAWYDESAQFDAQTLTDLFVSQGFGDVKLSALPLWNQSILFVTAVRR
jgi:SAM-dependent methyltransferase